MVPLRDKRLVWVMISGSREKPKSYAIAVAFNICQISQPLGVYVYKVLFLDECNSHWAPHSKLALGSTLCYSDHLLYLKSPKFDMLKRASKSTNKLCLSIQNTVFFVKMTNFGIMIS